MNIIISMSRIVYILSVLRSVLGEGVGEGVLIVRGVMVGTEPVRFEEILGLVLVGPENVRRAVGIIYQHHLNSVKCSHFRVHKYGIWDKQMCPVYGGVLIEKVYSIVLKS